jgi:ZIP family zinc transporter
MIQLLIIAGISWAAGITAFLGGSVAHYERIPESEAKQEIIHGIVAFGGGILLAGVSFALAPEAIDTLHPWILAVTFCLGGIVFCILDALISRHGGRRSQFMAMLMDFLPEAISLGAVFSYNRRLGILLAAYIAAQNLPEGFNSFREIRISGIRPSKALMSLFVISFLGPVAAVSGYLFLRDLTGLTAGIMSFAAGGILYLIFQDIAPQSKLKRSWKPPLGAVLGFAAGMIAHKLIG